MPEVAATRKKYSDVVAGVMSYEGDTATNFNFDTVLVGGTGSIDNIGIPVVWDNSANFEVYLAQDISAVTGSPLAGGAPIAILVGSVLGKGLNSADTDISSDASFTALFRGDATVIEAGIDFGAATPTNIAEFMAQLELQRITTIELGEVVDPSYLG